ncbi:PREDICTED: uncharacterized protein LOC105570894, partial [Vollenhovia emeryi]|uniref:uncharacterized protein LOC105570894 n=1 Tax=Vollenhovia emeryi TaxID=411798 RepID=UPI0005F3D909
SAYNWLSTNISNNAESEEIQAQFALLKDKASEIEELNDKLQQLQLSREGTTEQELDEEISACDEYRLKYHRIKPRVLSLTQPVPIIKFSGELREWLQFWSLFKNIHEDRQITKEDKFQYLFQAMVKDSRAGDLVNSYPPIAENYEKVIKSLKSRFGKNELLIELYVHELLKLVLNNSAKSGKQQSVGNLYDKLETQLRALESLGVTTEMCAAMLYPLVESSLPEETLRV